MINIDELEVTRRLHSELHTDPAEWDRAMLRLRTIHLNNKNPVAACYAVRTYRARLGLALPDSEVSHDALRNYGYDVFVSPIPFI